MSLQLRRRIVHPDWVKGAGKRVGHTTELLAANRVPAAIEVFMIVTPVKHLLRGVYGSDLRAALVLLGQALHSQPGKIYGRLVRFWRYRVLCQSPDRAINEMLAEEDSEEEEAS